MAITLTEADLVQPATWGSVSTSGSIGEGMASWTDAAHRALVEWLEASIETQLSQLRQLPPDWDSYGAPAIDSQVFARVRAFLTDILSANMPAPHVVPTSKGGITLEWHVGPRELIVELVPDQAPMDAYFADEDDGYEWELPLPADGKFIPALISMESRE